MGKGREAASDVISKVNSFTTGTFADEEKPLLDGFYIQKFKEETQGERHQSTTHTV